jgi:type IV secretory pathway VirB6-like protein
MSILSQEVTQTGVGNSEAIDLFETMDIRISYALGVTGTVNYTVQHSLDGIRFFDNADNEAKTIDGDGNYVFPIRAVRVKVNSGSGSVQLYVRQLIV